MAQAARRLALGAARPALPEAVPRGDAGPLGHVKHVERERGMERHLRPHRQQGVHLQGG